MVNLLKMLFGKAGKFTKRTSRASTISSFLVGMESAPPSPPIEQSSTFSHFKSVSDTLPISFGTNPGTSDAIFVYPPLTVDGRVPPLNPYGRTPTRSFKCYATVCEAPNCPAHGMGARHVQTNASPLPAVPPTILLNGGALPGRPSEEYDTTLWFRPTSPVPDNRYSIPLSWTITSALSGRKLVQDDCSDEGVGPTSGGCFDIPSLSYTIDSALSGLMLGPDSYAGLAYPDTEPLSTTRIPPSMHYASTKRTRLRRV